MRKCLLFILSEIFMLASVSAQSTATSVISRYILQNEIPIVHEYAGFLKLPNVAAESIGLQNNRSYIMDMMKKKGIGNILLLSPLTPGAPAAVYGEVIVPGARHTLIFYAHYDGQPVNPAQWAPGLSPFQPLLFTKSLEKGGNPIPYPVEGNYNRDWRIYARGASDDKAGIDAILNAYDAIQKSGLTPGCNLKFFFEGEEEKGSTHLDEILEKYKTLLQSDLFIICDGPVHQSGLQQIAFGVRGDTRLDLTVYAAKRHLHSGHYGNWAPNPAMMLAALLASMKDENGKVTIKGFYDDVTPLSNPEKKALKEVPVVDEELKKELGLRAAEMKGVSLSEAINLPSLNINGMQSGNVGKLASNQIPTYATAVLDLRLVLGNDWKRQQQKVIDHIRSKGYHVIDHEPTDAEREQYEKIIKVVASADSYNAQRTAMDLPIIQKVIAAVRSTTEKPVVLQPTLGGSLPLFLFEQHLGAKTITIPIANYDNNQHGENENIRIGNLFDGISIMAAVMMIQ
ncbi:MAG: M20/M25/M40 family metallo-hydrolase [Terrimonas sp.]|nr:M20/M25/M40 family metallo-hydrolase [Terrimonas sp.]